MDGTWVRKPQSDTVVIFVHGILSSGEACWKSDSAYWPSLLAEEQEFSALGIYVFSYKTDIFSGSYSVSDIVDALKESGRVDGALNAKQLVFVCHSMGGIVARKLIVERAYDFIQAGQGIGLFLIASPSLGSDYGDWLRPIAQLLGHSQADVLRFGEKNRWLSELSKEFKNLKESGRLRIFGKELVEDTFVKLKRAYFLQPVVRPISGAVYFGEPFKVAGSDHFTISKPETKKAIQHKLLLKFIRESIEDSENSNAKSRTLAPQFDQQKQEDSQTQTAKVLATRLAVSPFGTYNGLSFNDDKYQPYSSFSFIFYFHLNCSDSSIKLLSCNIGYYSKGIICAGGNPLLRINDADVEFGFDGSHFCQPVPVENGATLIYSRKRCYPPLQGDTAGECDEGDIAVYFSYTCDGLFQPVECINYFGLLRNGHVKEINRIRDVPCLSDDYMKAAQEDGRIDGVKNQILLQYPATARYRAARSNNTSDNFADICDEHRVWLKTLYRGGSV